MNFLKKTSFFSLLFLVFLTSAQSLFAQTHTPRYNVSMTSNSGGYYEYLPEGYDPNGTTKHPVIIFIHGMYEKGSGGTSDLYKISNFGLPKYIKNGYFPKSFTVNGKTEKFVVISPQFKSTPTSSDVNNIITYVLNKYRVNPNKVYLTGLSMGGGTTWAFGANSLYNTRIAAMVPICGAASSTTDKDLAIAKAGIKVWATHNKYDDVVSSSKTVNWVNGINAANPPVDAKMTIFSRTGHDAWTKTYQASYEENGLNIYEWMLQYERGSTSTPTTTVTVNAAPVANAGSNKTITLPTASITLSGSASDADGSISKYSWTKTSGPTSFSFSSTSVASPIISSLIAGTYTFRLTVTDNDGATDYDDVSVVVNPLVSIAPAPSAAAKSIQVNLYGGTNAYSSSAWNNWNVNSSLSLSSLKYNDASASTVSAALSKSDGVNDNGSTYGAGMAPAEVLRYASNATTSRTLTLSGLSTSKTYNLELFGSRDNYSGNFTVFTINGVAQNVSTYKNLAGTAAFTNVAPNSSGQIVVTIANSQDYNYLNGFVLTEAKVVQVNLYGGSYAYSNAAWNNWNVSSLSSGALKYSDASSSAITAALSKSSGVNDNGSTYGSGMAPAGVLRYASNATVARTLTISGLSVDKTYSLELYASRNNYSGNYTVFTINGVTERTSTYRNFTGKAVFSSLVPSSSGTIVVNISNDQDYNYLNGFTIVEGASSAAATARLTTTTTTTSSTTETLESSIVVSPNPFTDKFALKVTNNLTGAVKAQIVDSKGVIKKEFSLTKTFTGTMQTYLSAGELPAGSYIIKVQMTGWSQTLPVGKL